MHDYNAEKWVALYRSALVELEQALMAGRILEARKEIAARVEALRDIPGLHTHELHAIDDALRTLKLLEVEDAKYAADQHKEVAQEALRKLRRLEPTIMRLNGPIQEAE